MNRDFWNCGLSQETKNTLIVALQVHAASLIRRNEVDWYPMDRGEAREILAAIDDLGISHFGTFKPYLARLREIAGQ
jgi:hypothetical protein